DKEVTGVSGLLYRIQLKVESRTNFLRDFAVAFFRALIGKVTQVFIFAAKLGWYIKAGQQYIALERVRLDFAQDFFDGVERFRKVGKGGFHFFSRLEVILVVGQSVAMATSLSDRRRSKFTLLDTEQYIVGVRLADVEIERLVGSKILHVVFRGEPQ